MKSCFNKPLRNRALADQKADIQLAMAASRWWSRMDEEVARVDDLTGESPDELYRSLKMRLGLGRFARLKLDVLAGMAMMRGLTGNLRPVQ